MSDDDMGMQQELPEGSASMPQSGMEQSLFKARLWECVVVQVLRRRS